MRDDDWQYFHDPEFTQLLDEYETAQEQGRPLYLDADELTDIAEYYMLLHDEERALQAIRLATELHPESVDPQVFLARQEMFHDRLDEARRICDAIPDQQDEEVAFLRAEILLREGRAEEASQQLADAYDQADGQRSSFLYDAAGVFLDYAQWDIAHRWAQRLLAEFPQNRKGQYLMADVLFSSGQTEQAIAQLNRLLDLDPYYAEAWNLLAEAQSSLDEHAEALESAEYVLAIRPDDRQALLTKAHCLFHLNDLEQAHQIYRQLIDIDPHDDTVYYYDSLCLTNLDRYEEAAEALRCADEEGHGMSQEQMHIRLQQAYVESKLHHRDEAIRRLDEARQLATADETFEYPLLLGQIYLDDGQTKQAGEHFQQALNESRDPKNTLLLIGIAYTEAMYYEEAVATLTTLLKHYGTDDGQAAFPYLAYCYYCLEDDEAFLGCLRQAVAASRETTQYLFADDFPNMSPEDYYDYAFQTIYGRPPQQGE